MMKFYAHRGFSGRYPENTMEAFRRAAETGCDGIELDVQLTRDHIPVIIHDETVNRTTDGIGWVRDHTLAQIRRLNAAAGFQNGLSSPDAGRSNAAARQQVPILEEYLAFARECGIYTNLELKTSICDYPGIEETVLRLIDAYGLRAQMLISSFNHYSILRMRDLAPNMKYAFLTEDRMIDAAGYGARYGIDALHPEHHLVNKAYTDAAHEKELQVNVWTVNTETDIRRMVAAGADGIIGNFPDKAMRLLKG